MLLTNLSPPQLRTAGFPTKPEPTTAPTSLNSTLEQLTPTAPAHTTHRFPHPFIALSEANTSPFLTLRNAVNQGLEIPPTLGCLTLHSQDLRGNRSRRWASAPGNLHLTCAFRRNLDAKRCGPALSALPVVATTEILNALLPANAPAQIKWVNDITIGPSKIAGILTACTLQGPLIDHVFFGIGINLATTPNFPPDPFVPSATCLAQHRTDPLPTLAELSLQLLDSLSTALTQLAQQGPAPLMDRYRHHSACLNHSVGIWKDDGRVPNSTPPIATGTLTHIHNDLTLQLDSHPTPIHHGRLAYLHDLP